jgi:hypothetical protein
VVDASDEHDQLFCHIYQEGDGKKGGNNVAYLLMKTLRAGILNILLDDNTKGKELNVVFDNCPGNRTRIITYCGWFHTWWRKEDTSILS